MDEPLSPVEIFENFPESIFQLPPFSFRSHCPFLSCRSVIPRVQVIKPVIIEVIELGLNLENVRVQPFIHVRTFPVLRAILKRTPSIAIYANDAIRKNRIKLPLNENSVTEYLPNRGR